MEHTAIKGVRTPTEARAPRRFRSTDLGTIGRQTLSHRGSTRTLLVERSVIKKTCATRNGATKKGTRRKGVAKIGANRKGTNRSGAIKKGRNEQG